MPRIRLASGPARVSRFDVLGQRTGDDDSFISHVCLHDADVMVAEPGAELQAVHMQPPLSQGPMSADVACTVPLRNEEKREIAVWLEIVRDELVPVHALKQYVVHPPWEDVRDPVTGVRRYRRYSCAGFVLDSYRQVGIDLCQTEASQLPELTLDSIMAAYPHVRGRSDLLEALGLQGRGPWRIVLAGYVLHALNRPSEEIRARPYQAEPGDERFAFS